MKNKDVIIKAFKVNRDLNEYLKALPLPIKTKRNITLNIILNDYPNFLKSEIDFYPMLYLSEYPSRGVGIHCHGIKFYLNDNTVDMIELKLVILNTISGVELKEIIKAGLDFHVEENVTLGEFTGFNCVLDH